MENNGEYILLALHAVPYVFILTIYSGERRSSRRRRRRRRREREREGEREGGRGRGRGNLTVSL